MHQLRQYYHRMAYAVRLIEIEQIDYMPDQTAETSRSNASAAPAAAPSTTSISQGIGLCAAVIALSFFLPWINFLGMKASGFDLVQKSGGASLLLWAIPFFGIVGLLTGMTKSTGVKTAGQIAGIIPFFALGYGLYDSGADLLKLLGAGAYLGLIAAGVTLVLTSRLK
jgi:hypothetical protein